MPSLKRPQRSGQSHERGMPPNPKPAMNLDELKREAGFYAADNFIESGMRVGLGHGSTVRSVLFRLSERIRAGQLTDLLAVPVSKETAKIAAQLHIPLSTLEEHTELDVCIDGADEVDPQLNLIKGLGGALLREKIVARAARQLVVIVDETKWVSHLGERSPLPVEVLPFGWITHQSWLEGLGCIPAIRRSEDGKLFVSDNDNYIYDCRFEQGIADAAHLESTLNTRPGVMENGLFVGMADRVVIATQAGVQVRERAA